MVAPAEAWTVDDLQRLSDAGFRCELIQGELRKMSPTGGRHGWATHRLQMELARYIEPRHLGIILPAETGVDLTRPDETTRTVLAADVTVVDPGQADAVDVDGYPAVIPVLVVETASPTQTQDEMNDKARLWIERGVALVWVVWPARQRIAVWRAGVDRPEIVGGDGVLDGGTVIPGLRIDVGEVFRRPAEFPQG